MKDMIRGIKGIEGYFRASVACLGILFQLDVDIAIPLDLVDGRPVIIRASGRIQATKDQDVLRIPRIGDQGCRGFVA